MCDCPEHVRPGWKGWIALPQRKAEQGSGPWSDLTHTITEDLSRSPAFPKPVIGQIVNIARSMPFIILMVALMGFTRSVTGTTIGREAAIVPLAIGAIPFFARLVETAVREVDGGLVEAVQSMGGSTWTVVRRVLVPESLPSLISSTTTTIVALIGYSAMAGTVGAGGLGDIAIRYGYQRFDTQVMVAVIVLLVALVSIVQVFGDALARRLNHRR